MVTTAVLALARGLTWSGTVPRTGGRDTRCGNPQASFADAGSPCATLIRTRSIRAVFEEDGLPVITIDLRDVRAGRLDVGRLRERHGFDVVVFDITLPYQATWQLFGQLRARDLSGLPVVLTTTNERALTALIGTEVQEPVMEIWGKPYDIERLRASVLAALEMPERRESGRERRRSGAVEENDRRAGDRRRRPDLAHSGASGRGTSRDATCRRAFAAG